MVLEFSGSSQLEKDPHVRVGVKSIGWKRTFYGCLVIFYPVLRAAHSRVSASHQQQMPLKISVNLLDKLAPPIPNWIRAGVLTT